MAAGDVATLLRAVLDAPDDDAPRLVYADALLERGDPRGELIALQCALVHDHDAAAVARVDELLAEHGARWRTVLGSNIEDAEFARGFVEHVHLACAELAEPALGFLDHEPVEGMWLGLAEIEPGSTREVASWFARDPRTARLRTLHVADRLWGREAIEALFRADLSALRDLSIGDHDAQAYTAAAIVDNPSIGALASLRVCGDREADFNLGIALIAACRRLRLARLRLGNARVGAAGCQAIASSPSCAGLVELDLTSSADAMNDIDDRALGFLARSPNLGVLADLAVGGNAITDEGLAELREPGALAGLRRLDLGSCVVTGAGVAAVAPRLAGLEALVLAGCPIGDEGAMALAQTEPAALIGLDLRDCGIGRAGIEALLRWPQLERLAWLRLNTEDDHDDLVARLVERMRDRYLG